MSDFDWTDHGTAEDHADRLEELSMQVGKAGRYNESATLHVSSNCIRGLLAMNEVLEKENEALLEALNTTLWELNGAVDKMRAERQALAAHNKEVG